MSEVFFPLSSKPSALQALLAISLLAFPALASPSAPVQTAPFNHKHAPASPFNAAFSSQPQAAPAAQPFVFTLGRSRREKRDPGSVAAWALREKARVENKYLGDQPAAVRKRSTVEKREEKKKAKRQAELEPRAARTTATTARTLSGGTVSGTGAAKASATSVVGLVDILNYEADLEYFAPIGVGAPPQYMNVILDTGSADLWIASSACTNLTGCAGIPTYNTTISNSSRDSDSTFSVKYGSGSASGRLVTDYVSFAGYNVSGQAFALCDTVSDDLLNGNISGLFGLGWEQLAASGTVPFWQNLFVAGVLPFPGFAFSLSRFANVSKAAAVEPGGSVTFGYLNESLYVPSTLEFVSIPSGLESYWVIPMDAVAVNNTNATLPSGTNYAAIDTGTTLIGGPSDVVSAIYAGIPGAQAATGQYAGYYSYPCAAKVDVNLFFGGVNYSMSDVDFNLGSFGVSGNVSTCLGAFFDLSLSSSSKISWVIGAAFLKNVYSVFRANPPSVGFALLSDQYNASTAGMIYNGTAYVNATNIPTGIYGPSGVVSNTAAASPTVVQTTAIQAGQSASTAPNAKSAAAPAAQPLIEGQVRWAAAVVGVVVGAWWVM